MPLFACNVHCLQHFIDNGPHQCLGVCEVSHTRVFIVSLAVGVCLLFTNMSLKCEVMGSILG